MELVNSSACGDVFSAPLNGDGDTSGTGSGVTATTGGIGWCLIDEDCPDHYACDIGAERCSVVCTNDSECAVGATCYQPFCVPL